MGGPGVGHGRSKILGVAPRRDDGVALVVGVSSDEIRSGSTSNKRTSVIAALACGITPPGGVISGSTASGQRTRKPWEWSDAGGDRSGRGIGRSPRQPSTGRAAHARSARHRRRQRVPSTGDRAVVETRRSSGFSGRSRAHRAAAKVCQKGAAAAPVGTTITESAPCCRDKRCTKMRGAVTGSR